MAKAKRKRTTGPPSSLTVPLPPGWSPYLAKARAEMRAAEARGEQAAEDRRSLIKLDGQASS